MNDFNIVYNFKCFYMLNVVCIVVVFFLIVVGLFGNIMIIMFFYKLWMFRISVNFYIVNMVILDLIFIILVGFWFILEYFIGFNIFNCFSIKSMVGDFLC